MFHRALAAEVSTTSPGEDPVSGSAVPCDRTALKRLTTAFNEAKPIAFLIGAGKGRSNKVIDRFVEAANDQTNFVRVSGPFTDATSCMRAVINSIGFDSKDFGLADLESIFRMFLSFQKTHDRRTVICIDDAQDCSSWVFDKVLEFAKLELTEKFGLLVILSGGRRLAERVNKNAHHAETARTGRHIFVAPLTLAETKEFVIQRTRAEGSDDIGHIFELDAITRLYEISAGVSDKLSGLCDASLQLAADEAALPISVKLVNRAAGSIGLVHETLSPVVEDEESLDQGADGIGRLILRVRGQGFGEHTLHCDNVSIGRGSSNDLRIPSLLVSRHHALIAIGKAGAKLMDLGSTNGTAVNGEKVKSCVLKNGDSIVLGDCQIMYVAADHHLQDEMVSAEILDCRS